MGIQIYIFSVSLNMLTILMKDPLEANTDYT